MRKIMVLGILILGYFCLAGYDTARKDSASFSPPCNAAEILHVLEGSDALSSNGSAEHPFSTIPEALSEVRPGVTILIHGGTYQPFEVSAECSGTEGAPVTICAAPGEKPVIQGAASIGVHLINVDNFVLSGLEIAGGTHGIYYESTTEQGEKALENITIQNCIVQGIRGTHGICVYAANDRAPIKNIIMENCRVYDCRCDSSEATVFNGNIDGFVIRNNEIHDNNNIGIDMIGFEGTAKHNRGDQGNPYAVDFVRNGKCYGNVVYAISTYGNKAYREGTAYNLCAGGIYVDGGQNIEIFNNFIFDCDIGIEVATEHSPDDNPLFCVTGIAVHDNVIASCRGYCGLVFGGYASKLGLTKDCCFHNNTLIDNHVHMVIQRSASNQIHHNLFVGGEVGIEFNTDCDEQDLVNHFGENYFCMKGSVEDLFSIEPYQSTRIFPKAAQEKQRIENNRTGVLDGFYSKVSGFGSSFIPNDTLSALYVNQLKKFSKLGLQPHSNCFQL